MEFHPAGWHTTKTCQICGKTLSLHEGFAGQTCSHWQCRWTHLDNQLKEYRQVAAQTLGVDAFETYKPVVVPFRVGIAAPLPSNQKRAFRERIARLVDKAGQQKGDDRSVGRDLPYPGSTPRTVPDDGVLFKVCTVCEGVCCYHGKDGAFLDVEAIGRFLSAHPGMSRETAVAVYLGPVPHRGYEGSCVYHTDSGCALPRALRAPLCVGYECHGLKDLREHVCTTGQSRGFVAVRHDARIIRSAFIDVSSIRHYPHRGSG